MSTVRMGSLTRWHRFREAFAAEPVLRPYRQPPSAVRRLLAYMLFFCFCIALGLFYGLALAILPPSIFLYFVLILAIPVLLIIWAMPSEIKGPVKALEWLFLGCIFVICVWPTYVAFSISGLPWISFIRLLGAPMTVALLVCFKSAEYRASFVESARNSRLLVGLLLAFQAVQVLTIPLSYTVFMTINLVIYHVVVWTAIAFVTFWYVQNPLRAKRWERLLILIALLQCVMGILEKMNGQILWADYVPSFLQVDAEILQTVKEGLYRDGKYRVTSSFTVSLSFAELLACLTPFIACRITYSTNILRIVSWVAFDGLLLIVINSTQSRLGIVGWIVAHMVIIGAWGVRRWRNRLSDIIGPAVSLLYPIGAALFLLAVLTVPAVHNRTIGGGSTGLSDDSRRTQFRMFWPKILHNPIGNGAGQSGNVLQYRVPSGFLTVDSYVITLNLDYGVLGFALWYGMLFAGAYVMLRAYLRASSDYEATKYLAVGTALIVMGFTRYVLSQEDTVPLFFMFVGAAAGYYAGLRADETRLTRGNEPAASTRPPSALQPASS